MNPFARTLLHQANQAIDAGAMSQAMDLLRQARILARSDENLVREILKQMIRIAPACQCESEAAVWQRQVDSTALAAIDQSSVPKRLPTPPTVSIRTHRIARYVLASGLALALIAVSLTRFRSYFAGRAAPSGPRLTATRPASSSQSTQPS